MRSSFFGGIAAGKKIGFSSSSGTPEVHPMSGETATGVENEILF